MAGKSRLAEPVVRCLLCDRVLSDPESIKAKMGPVCRGYRKEALDVWEDIDKASREAAER